MALKRQRSCSLPHLISFDGVPKQPVQCLYRAIDVILSAQKAGLIVFHYLCMPFHVIRDDWTTSSEWGMSRALLKLSGSLVHDYATISDDSPSPNRASRARRAATSAGIS